jgi:hypothetical protein
VNKIRDGRVFSLVHSTWNDHSCIPALTGITSRAAVWLIGSGRIMVVTNCEELGESLISVKCFNTLWTGDTNLRHLRFCVTTVKDG